MGGFMEKKRVRHSAEFKAQVALETLKGLKTVNVLAGQYQVHPMQIGQWKRQGQMGARELFATDGVKSARAHEAVQGNLYEEVSRLKMELDWIKKLPGSVEDKRQWSR